jgi:uracil-DNA glycosylase family 4
VQNYKEVPDSGNPQSKIVFIGEQPGRTEMLKGRPFCGPSGDVLTECMFMAGLTRTEGYYTNVIPTLSKPLDSFVVKTDRKNDGDKGVIVSQEGAIYINALNEKLNKIDPIVVVPIGNVALYATLRLWGITKWAGSIIKSSNRYYVPTIHPATVLPPKGQYENKRLIAADMIKAHDILKGLYKPTERVLEILPSYEAAMAFIQYCIDEGEQGNLVGFDTEVLGDGLNKFMSCFSLSTRLTAMSIPLINMINGKFVEYFSAQKEADIINLLAKLLEAKTIRKVGHNLTFDNSFMFREYGLVVENFDDTMIAQQIIMGVNYRKGLDMVTRLFTDLKYYKGEGKEYIPQFGKFKQFLTYSALDAIVPPEAFEKQYAIVKRQNNEATYKRQLRTVQPYIYMMEHGIKVDIPGMLKATILVEKEKQQLLDEIMYTVNTKYPNEKFTEAFPRSGPQLKRYFHELERAPVYQTLAKKTGFDDLVLQRLIRKGYTVAKLISKYRKLGKKLNYLDLSAVDPDGRMRCTYNTVGTKFSRSSSSPSLYGTGMNMQNWPHDLLTYLIPDEGYVYYSLDYSQAENRAVAAMANCRAMIEAFERGLDLHSITGALIASKILGKTITPTEVKEQHKKDIKAPTGGGIYTWRDIGKRANHGLNYNLGYKSAALRWEMSEKDACVIVETGYHESYPEIRNVYHADVRNSIRKSRTVTNAMGRVTTFYGSIDKQYDDTFAQGYDCLAQGLIGDTIHEYGIIPTYYEDRFRVIELLSQTHDSLGEQISLTYPWRMHASLLLDQLRTMEVTHTFRNGNRMKFPVDVMMGRTLNKGKYAREFSSGKLPRDKDELAKLLQTSWEEITKEYNEDITMDKPTDPITMHNNSTGE